MNTILALVVFILPSGEIDRAETLPVQTIEACHQWQRSVHLSHVNEGARYFCMPHLPRMDPHSNPRNREALKEIEG